VYRHSAFGLRIRSDLQLPELTRDLSAATLEGGTAPEITIAEASHHDWPVIQASPHSTPTLAMAAGDWRLELEGVGWFRAWDGNRLSWERWDDSVSDRDVRTFLVTSGLGALLIQRGALVLNATTLVRYGKALLLLGSPTRGKSTLAWCLLQQGWQLLSSELTVVDSEGLVWPGIQQLKLWHDSAVALGLDWQNLSPVRRGLKRYALGRAELPVAANPTPLALIYGLGRRKSTSHKSEKEKPEGDQNANQEDESSSSDQRLLRAWARKSEREALLTLRNQAYQPRFYRAMEQEANLFLKASHLLKRVPVHSLNASDGIITMRNALETIDLFNPDSLFREEELPAAVEIEG
jgi:hypothetical protein